MMILDSAYFLGHVVYAKNEVSQQLFRLTAIYHHRQSPAERARRQITAFC